MNKQQQIEEFQNDITDNLFGGGTYKLAEDLYNAGYRKETQFIENMKNVLEIEKKQAVKEFAEKLKEAPRINNQGLEFVALVDIDAELKALLKEYENE